MNHILKTIIMLSYFSLQSLAAHVYAHGLMVACCDGCPSLVQEGDSALICAVKKGHRECVRYLLDVLVVNQLLQKNKVRRSPRSP